MADLLSIPEALYELFRIRVASDCEYLRNTANSFVRNELLAATPKVKGEQHRHQSKLINRSQLPTLQNAILLHAFMADTAKVKRVFQELPLRKEVAVLVAGMLRGRNSVLGILLQSGEVDMLIHQLEGDQDLRQIRLANPFAILPQQYLGGEGSLLSGILAQAGALAAGDSLLLAYLLNDLAGAYTLATQLPDAQGELAALRDRVLADYADALALDNALAPYRRP